MLIEVLLGSHIVEALLNESSAQVLMVPDLLQILTVESERMLIVGVDLAKLVPQLVYVFHRDVDLLSQLV